MERRRRYDRQFKIEAVRLVTEGGRKATEIARDLGFHVNVIYLWKKQLAADPGGAFPGLGKMKASDEEVQKLRRQLADITEERDSKNILEYPSLISGSRRILKRMKTAHLDYK
ncbi:MAG: transposase [Candidatus Zixiibacteriota bacterium]